MAVEAQAGNRSGRRGDELRRARRRLWKLALAGALLLSAAIGVRAWWSATAPQRNARLAAMERRRVLVEQLVRAQAAVEKRPRDPSAYAELANAMLAAGRVDDAIAAARKGTQAAPDERQAWEFLGNLYLSQKRFAAAEETYRRITQKWPRNAEAYQALAVVYRHTGRYREGLKAARAAIRVGADQPLAHYVLGALIEELGQRVAFPQGETALLEEGRGHLLTAARGLPNHPDVYYRLGRVCLLLRRVDEANRALETAARLTPQRPVVWLALSDVRTRRGDIDGAIAAAREAQKVAPSEPEAPLAVGRALLLKSDPKSLEEALAAIQEAARLAPASYPCQERLGTALMRRGQLPEARRAFERAVSLDPNNAYPPQQLAQIYQRLGDVKLASAAAKQASALSFNQKLLRQLQRASSGHPENPAIHLTLAKRYRELGWLPQAEDEYLQTLALTPENTDARDGLAATRKLLAEKQAP